jgi:hypothetical protein
MLNVAFSYRYTEYQYANCCYSDKVMLNVIMLSVMAPNLFLVQFDKEFSVDNLNKLACFIMHQSRTDSRVCKL